MRDATIADVLSGKARWAVFAGDCANALPEIPDRSIDHSLQDPPYSQHVHGKQRRMLRGSGGRAAAGQKAGRGEVGPAELGFDALTAATRNTVAQHLGRIVRRWALTFSDAESADDWREELEAFGLSHVRVGAWVKIAGQPQLTGDRPAVGFEAIEIAHGPERKRWNNGGHPAVWHHLIATDRNGTGDRVHTTQKPLSLMLDLVEHFTDPDDVVLDCFAGSGTTGVACLRLGRRFIGCELDPTYAAIARERLEAESRGLNLRAARAGQRSLFEGLPLPPPPEAPTPSPDPGPTDGFSEWDTEAAP